MKTIHISASNAYDVIVGQGLLSQLGNFLKKFSKAQKVAIISDSNVWPLYGQTVRDSVLRSGICQAFSYVFPAGEQSKNPETYISILNWLAENRLTRSDCLIALGGGVVGDMTGFVAATYLRGIDYIQLPTTLLAAVDSSVGGKTAIDLPAGKNLVGAFYQPRLVLCDTDTLNTLPESVFRDGCAEVIKYGILYDANLCEHMMQEGLHFQREEVIARCVALKRDVVARDEFDRGERQMLNLGHTIGHSVEAQSNFTVTHGQAVSIGMAIVSRASAAMDICTTAVSKEITRLLERFGLPVTTPYSADALFISALSDKKCSGGIVNLIVPEAIGVCQIRPTSVEHLKAFIEAGL